MDDASRMILAGGEFDSPTTENAIATVEKALEVARRWNLQVREVLTDRGSAFFVNNTKGKARVESEFSRYLVERGVRHVVTMPHNPQSNGKIERFWLEYDRHRWRFASLEEFIDFANGLIHGALWDLETPREAFQRKLPPEALLGLHMKQVEAMA
jgi:putative transposase